MTEFVPCGRTTMQMRGYHKSCTEKHLCEHCVRIDDLREQLTTSQAVVDVMAKRIEVADVRTDAAKIVVTDLEDDLDSCRKALHRQQYPWWWFVRRKLSAKRRENQRMAKQLRDRAREMRMEMLTKLEKP